MSFQDPNVEKRLNALLPLLKPFNRLRPTNRNRINVWKVEFPDPGNTILTHLKRLGVEQLENHVFWLPPSRFTKFEKLADGGFASVWAGTVENKHTKVHEGNRTTTFALKELKAAMVPELVLNVLFNDNGTFYFPTIPVVGLSQHPQTQQYLMVMWLATNGTLENMKLQGQNNWSDVATVARRLAANLADLHECGFSHRDLHPGNLAFLDSLVEPFLIDVGLAQSVEDDNECGGVYGRLPYLAPEAMTGHGQTQASDVYGFSTLLWQFVVGVQPRLCASQAIRFFPEKLREELVPGAPPQFNNILRKCWNPDPEKRPTMAEVEQLMSQWFKQSGKLYENKFTPETLAFIARRRSEFQLQESEKTEWSMCEGKSSSKYFTVVHHKSQFHSKEMLHAVSRDMSFTTLPEYKEFASRSLDLSQVNLEAINALDKQDDSELITAAPDIQDPYPVTIPSVKISIVDSEKSEPSSGMEIGDIVDFGVPLSLRHRTTGRYLAVLADDSNSLKVCTAVDPHTWVVNLAWNNSNTPQVQNHHWTNGSRTCFTHVASGLTLCEEPGRLSPITGQQEITCKRLSRSSRANPKELAVFAPQPSYRRPTEKVPVGGDVIRFGDSCIFRTSEHLHLHSHANKLSNGCNEVSALNKRDDVNDEWTILPEVGRMMQGNQGYSHPKILTLWARVSKWLNIVLGRN